MKKYKFFINLDKEEQWLNHMARSGHAFVRKSVRYEFQPAEYDGSTIRIDYRTFKNRRDFEDYRTLFRDSGWEHISGSKGSGAQYFRKVGKEGSDDIFSDVDSKAGRYQRMSRMWLNLAVPYLPIFVALSMNGTIDSEALLQPKLLYLTEGLWDRSGIDFWKAFLFETPFALMRGFLWAFFPITMILFAAFSLKAKKQYKLSKREE